jgi:OOP family OmpA-OmpF porin
MKTSARPSIAAGLLAGVAILLAPAITTPVAATDVAAASTGAASAAAAATAAAKPRPGYVVFFEHGRTELSPAATRTVLLAARAAQSSKARIVRIVGRADHAKAVKAELVRQGLPVSSIVLVGRDDSTPIVRASTSVAEPLNRRVLIAF